MKLTLQINNRIDEISRLEALVTELARERPLDKEFLNEVNLVLEELISNTILHGYPPDELGSHTIKIELILEEEALKIHITDDARRFNPLTKEPIRKKEAGKLQDMELGGLGLRLVHHFSDKIDYAYRENRNHLWIVKYIRY